MIWQRSKVLVVREALKCQGPRFDTPPWPPCIKMGATTLSMMTLSTTTINIASKNATFSIIVKM